LGDQWSAELGARFESFTQGIAYPNVAQSNSGELEHEAWYPAVNLSWRASEELQFRLGYSKTVSYPGLIERSASQSYDPATDDAIFGTPELTVSEINNIDFRVEYYFGQSNSVSLAVFNKQISNPVERAIPDASGSAADGITFRNQQEAVLDGIELDFNAIVFDQDDHSVFVNGNVSYIDSSVTLGAKSLQLEGMGSDGRQLQGQSEYLANLQIGYDHFPSGQKLTLLVNYFDDRIFRTARGAALGPIIETGRTLIDINYEKQFGEEWDLKFQIKNLTDEPISYSQNNRVIESYELGTSISLSLSYRL
jgi:outer membrane receptor protein involved in Fe transport